MIIIIIIVIIIINKGLSQKADQSWTVNVHLMK